MQGAQIRFPSDAVCNLSSISEQLLKEKHRKPRPRPAPGAAPRRRWGGPKPVLLALGVNQGDRLGTLERAWRALENQGIRPVRASRIFETRPLPASEGPAYYNACVEVETSLMPHPLLWRCQGIERAFGRTRERRWAARTLDIDLIAYGRLRIDTASLKVPHPRWFERDFVLWGLRDLGIRLAGVPAAEEAAQFDRWLEDAEPCILSARQWPLPGRPREGY